jgi:hypothetical protein
MPCPECLRSEKAELVLRGGKEREQVEKALWHFFDQD